MRGLTQREGLSTRACSITCASDTLTGERAASVAPTRSPRTAPPELRSAAHVAPSSGVLQQLCVYAPLAAWYNATGRAALRAKHGPLPATADAFYQWPTRNAVVMAFLDDQGVPPAF